MTFNIYGRNNGGKKRLADDILIPSHVLEDELVAYLADLCHEWPRKGNDLFASTYVVMLTYVFMTCFLKGKWRSMSVIRG